MTIYFEQIAFWHWFVLGVVLAGIEVLIPGTFLLWLGIAAGVVGLIALVAPGIGWELQFALFAVLAVLSVFIGRAVVRRFSPAIEENTLNRRGEQFVGRTFVLAEAIENGRGAIRVGDSIWRVQGPDSPTGNRVRVTASDGALLHVEPVEQRTN